METTIVKGLCDAHSAERNKWLDFRGTIGGRIRTAEVVRKQVRLVMAACASGRGCS